MNAAWILAFTAVALVVAPASASARWHLIAPPCAPIRVVLHHDGSKTLEPVTCEPNRRAPVSKWDDLGSFDTANACADHKDVVSILRNHAYLRALDLGPAEPLVIRMYRSYDQMYSARCISAAEPRLAR